VGKVSGCSGQMVRGAARNRVWMDPFGSRAAFAGSVLIFLLSLSALAQSPAPGAPTGGLSGKLTDLHSRPVDGAMLVLRNARTGVEARTTTTKAGDYRFGGLTPGEYMLEADSPRLGEWRIAGIFIPAGHESRVQTALAMDRRSPHAAVSPPQVRNFTAPTPPAGEPNAMANAPAMVPQPSQEKPVVIMPPLEAKISGQIVETLPLAASR